jgi:hypothetical protein
MKKNDQIIGILIRKEKFIFQMIFLERMSNTKLQTDWIPEHNDFNFNLNIKYNDLI